MKGTMYKNVDEYLIVVVAKCSRESTFYCLGIVVVTHLSQLTQILDLVQFSFLEF